MEPVESLHKFDCYLIHIVFLTEGVKNDVNLIEHVNHLHGCDVDTNFIKFDHIAKQDGDIWENLDSRDTERNYP